MEPCDLSLNFWEESRQHGWDCIPDCGTDALVVKTSSYVSAMYIFKNFGKVLRSWAIRFGLSFVIIRYGNSVWDFIDVEASVSRKSILRRKSTRNPFLASYSRNDVAPTLWSNFEMSVSVPLIYISSDEIITPVMFRIAEGVLGSEKDLCVTRDHDNMHIITSKSTTLALNVDGKETVKRNNADYWQGSDLATLKQNHRLHGESEFTMTYLATLDKPKFDKSAIWAKLAVSFKYFQNEYGIWYRRSELHDMQIASCPPIVF